MHNDAFFSGQQDRMDDNIKQKITEVFDTVSGNYDNPATRFFPFCADRLITHLQPRAGYRILDIATGTGAVALPAAQAVLPGGRVQAIDLSQKMLNIAARNMQRVGVDNVDYHVMDASQLDFKSNYFDAITCSFGLFFLPDMLSALKEWMRVLKPGGRLMFTTFADSAFLPLSEIFRSDMESFDVTFPEESWMRLTQAEQCSELLQQTGFEQIQVVSEQIGYHLNCADDWWEIIYNTGFRGFIDTLDNPQLAAFRQRHLENIKQHQTKDGIWMDVMTLFSSGQKPQ